MFADYFISPTTLTDVLKRTSPILQFMEGIIPGNNTPVIDDSLNGFDGIATSIGESPPSRGLVASPGTMSTLILAAKVACFLPWCITVGAALILFPQYLEFVTFQTGYLPSVQGVPRFAHWANYGLQHVVIFFASILAVGYYKTAFGVALGAFVLARFTYVWRNFKFNPSIPLGEDDRQSLYMVTMMESCGLDKDTVIYGVGEDNEILQSVIVDDDAWNKN
jgi:hypothetical protein